MPRQKEANKSPLVECVTTKSAEDESLCSSPKLHAYRTCPIARFPTSALADEIFTLIALRDED